MGFLEKVKNMFIEEYEDDEIKKEVIQVKIPTPEKKEEVKEEPIKHHVVEDKRLTEDNTDTRVIERKMEETEETPKQVLPKYFDDSDFEMPEERKEPEVVKQEYKYTRTETVIKPANTLYGAKKEEVKKNFTPTPIISPVYGVLDKNYKKEEISSKKKPTTIYTQFDKIDVDDIRKKAYGTLEDELEENLNDKDVVIFNDNIDITINTDNDEEICEYQEQPLDIFEELDKNDEIDDILNEKYDGEEDADTEESEVKEDDTNLVEDELNSNYDQYESDLHDSYSQELNDSDLFNLIDSMYDKKDGE
ncbi:MAG TPA: hypothetical protein PLV83_02245 [Bacilli bacterium]|nr:hypothetical protein [Bacilli bacterium]